MNFNCTLWETLTESMILDRLRSLNSRVKFPKDTVRNVMFASEGVEVIEFKNGSTADHRILDMRYTVKNAPTSLKWEWHLEAVASAKLYNLILSDSIATLNSAHDLLVETTDMLKAKDKELDQYRAEGFSLRRTTVVTKPFQFDAFKEEHKSLLADMDAYGDFAEEFYPDKSSPSSSPVPSASIHADSPLASPSTSSGRRAQNAITLPKTPSPSGSNAASNTGSSSGSSAKITPRLRKRKAQESNTIYMKQRVVERRVNHTYESSQSSQEQNIDDYFVVNEGNPKPVIVDNEESKRLSPSLPIKKETTKKESAIDTDGEAPAQTSPGKHAPQDSDELELEELKTIFNGTKKLIEEHTSEK
ncbi:hypothetical protein KR074_008844 [Drosophila pseudoananassae]|nr:hypothetical protein KR074_008844 [Drosophila pseudoananassae]